MDINDGTVLQLATALGIGFLIGAERERQKGKGPSRSPAGVRTFAVCSVLGALSILVGGELLLAVTFVGVTVLAGAAYWRSPVQDPGLTTEVSMLLTVLLGAFATQNAPVAAALGVTVTILLAARGRLHAFLRDALGEAEVADALLFAAATLVVLPLVPDRYVGPFAALNPRTIWMIVILIMSISAAGYIAVRLLGSRVGLPLAGLASGFVSSSATIAAMGARAAANKSFMRPAVAAAVLSTVATVVQMAVLVGATSQALLLQLAVPLLSAGVVAAVYGALFTVRSLSHPTPDAPLSGGPFSLRTALILAATLAAVMLLSAGLYEWLGRGGALVAAAVAGFADAHSPSASVASLVSAERLPIEDGVLAVLAALTTNTVVKIVVSFVTGGRQFAFEVVPGLLLVIAAAWLGAFFAG